MVSIMNYVIRVKRKLFVIRSADCQLYLKIAELKKK